jgi:hypothetical protein
MRRYILSILLGPLAAAAVAGQTFEAKPKEPFFEKYQPRKAPSPSGLMLKKGDRLAICGDSITEQKMYSRMIETYLTVCVPELEIAVRQYGWGGETASGFLARMTNDCLRFKPTIATTCYGMNDHRYRAYEESIGKLYREKQTAIVEAFKANGARVVLGSPGCVSHKPEALNLNLCELRNIDIEIAEEEKVGFADVFWPMLMAGFYGQQKDGTNFFIAGRDGIHPDWPGQLVMAYAFLKGFGLDGEIGTFTVDLALNTAKVSKGHELLSARNGEFEIRSSRYPLCAVSGPDVHKSVRMGMALVPFNRELNRLVLVAKSGKAQVYKVTWGGVSKSYSADQLAKGINLAEDFESNPFVEAFNKVDKAVATKQSYETKQIKQIFHDLVSGKYKSADDLKDEEMKQLFSLRNNQGQFDLESLEKETEKKRAPLAEAIQAAFVPVTHTIQITPE